MHHEETVTTQANLRQLCIGTTTTKRQNRRLHRQRLRRTKNHHPMHHERKPTYHAYNRMMEKAMRRIKMIPLLKNDDDGRRTINAVDGNRSFLRAISSHSSPLTGDAQSPPPLLHHSMPPPLERRSREEAGKEGMMEMVKVDGGYGNEKVKEYEIICCGVNKGNKRFP
ncbi:hypothetical protein Dimus_039267 [Dionaea muscipula]